MGAGVQFRSVVCLVVVVKAWAQSAGLPVLTLGDAVELAKKGNAEVQISSLEVTRSAQATAETKTSRFPQFKTYILGGSTLNTLNFTVPAGVFGVYTGIGPVPAKSSQITMSPRFNGVIYGSAAQPLSQLFKIRLAIRESQLGEEVAKENLRQQRQQTVSQVRQAYYQLAQTQSQMESAQANLKYLNELQGLTERSLAQEVVLKSDLLNVKAKLSQQKYQIFTLDDALKSQKEALNRLLGRDLNIDFKVEVQTPGGADDLDLEAAEKRALDQRPEIRKAKLQVTKSELDIRRERAEYLPNVSLTFSYLALPNITFLPQNYTNAGFQFDWQPYDWGQKRHHLEQLRTSAQESALTSKDAQQQVLLDVRSKYRKLLEARALLDTQAAVQETEREKMRVMMNRYGQKSALLSDVLQQQASVAQADDQYRQAVASFWAAKADFDRALGEE